MAPIRGAIQKGFLFSFSVNFNELLTIYFLIYSIIPHGWYDR